jgi:hypothetical protein
LLRRRAVGGDQRHHAYPGLEPRQAQHEQREGESGGAEHGTDAAARGERRSPRGQRVRVGKHVVGADEHDDSVEQQEHRDERDRDDDGLGEPEEEDPAQDQQQHDRDRDGVTCEESG